MSINTGVLFDPSDAVAMASAVFSVVGDTKLCDNLAARGYERSKQFTWEKTAAKTVEVYSEAFEESRRKVGER